MKTNPEVVDVAIVGCGIFGAEIALKAKASGLSVAVYEAKSDILSGASANNQNRLHLGFHYPRDLETGKQSIRGFSDFKEKYAGCIQGEFLNAYFIANDGSFTAPDAYLNFCEELGVSYQPIAAGDLPVTVHGADTGILCEEVVYDCGILRSIVWQNLHDGDIEVNLNHPVEKISKQGDVYKLESAGKLPVLAKTVVNASYGNINRLTRQLGHEVAERLYEYTVVPIIRLDMPRIGVTIMDGPFMTMLPYGKSDSFLLYHVDLTVIAKEVSTQLNQDWLDPSTGPFAGMDKQAFFHSMIDLCKGFVPELEKATLAGFLEGPRMVLARRDDSDARPSIVTSYDDSYYTVFAGKIDHSIWVADDVCVELRNRFNI